MLTWSGVVKNKPTSYSIQITVNKNQITTVLIGRHYLKKHSSYMNDDLILELVGSLDGHSFPIDSISSGIEYYVADVHLSSTDKTYRIIWLFEGEKLEILGVINAYRRVRKRKV